MTDTTTPFDTFLDEMKVVIRSTMADLQAGGRLAPAMGYDSYKFSFIYQWNTFVQSGFDGMETYDARFLVDDIFRTFAKEIYSKKFRFQKDNEDLVEDDPKVINYLHESLAEMMAAGDMEYAFNGIEAHSPIIQERHNITLHGWHPKVQKYDTESRKFVEPAVLEIKPITHMEIDLPTGEMLIADWLRIEAFSKIMDDAHKGYNICHARERIKRTINGVQAFKLLEVMAGSYSPAIVTGPDGSGTAGGQLRIGHRCVDEFTDEPDNPDLEVVGKVSTQYRGITLMDKADMIDLISPGIGPAEAAEQVEKLIAEHPYHKPCIVQLAPGPWHFYFIDNAVSDIDHLEQATDALGQGLETTVLLSRTPVDFPEHRIRHA